MKYIPLAEATPDYYEQIGLKSGLEIHQQLLTDTKLFCRCPAGIYSRDWDAEVLRHMRPTLSEMGEYDGTALMEFKTRKEIVYRIKNETVCTYEFDDTPPFMIDEQAVDIAIEAVMQLGGSLVSELHITRKQYLDGSIPTGFQRTTIIGVGGRIPYKDRWIDIIQLSLEEDSCREISDTGHRRIYITDRLGMPLIETVTDCQMHTPQDVAGVAEVLRRLVRATGKVRTGSGAGREDTNVSVRGGERCEIKGVGSIRLIPILVHNEAFRQVQLLEMREELLRRGITPESFAWRSQDLSELAEEAPADVQLSLQQGGELHAVLLEGFAGLLGKELSPGRNFLSEISDRVRVIACVDTLPNVLGSDGAGDTDHPGLWQKVRAAMQAADEDALVLVWGPVADMPTALNEIAIRAREATIGVPRETRQPMPDGTTRFERILPGADRMYPDTDLPPQAIEDERVERIRTRLPLPPWQVYHDALADGLHVSLAEAVSISPYASLYSKMRDTQPELPASLLAQFLCEWTVDARRRGAPEWKLETAFLHDLLTELAAGRVLPAALHLLLIRDTRAASLAEMIIELGLTPATENDVADAIECALAQTPATSDAEALHRFVMGEAMRSLRGRVMGRSLAERVSQELEARA